MSERVSVLIPTYNRPALLREAIDSVLAQTVPVYEVLVGDDGTLEPAGGVIEEVRATGPQAEVRYFRNEPSKGQGPNVQALLEEAVGEFVMVLHDDDLLLPGAIATLLEPFATHPEVDATFGDNQLISHDGDVVAGSEINEWFYKTSENEGLLDPEEASLLQMFPNDAFLVRRKTATEVGYYHPEFGTSVDLAFGIKLGLVADRFFYRKMEVSQYRDTVGAVSDNSTGAYYYAKYVLARYPAGHPLAGPVSGHLRKLMPMAIQIAGKLGDPRQALRWCFSSYHRRALLSPGGAKRVLVSIGLVAREALAAGKGSLRVFRRGGGPERGSTTH